MAKTKFSSFSQSSFVGAIHFPLVLIAGTCGAVPHWFISFISVPSCFSIGIKVIPASLHSPYHSLLVSPMTSMWSYGEISSLICEIGQSGQESGKSQLFFSCSQLLFQREYKSLSQAEITRNYFSSSACHQEDIATITWIPKYRKSFVHSWILKYAISHRQSL